MSRSPPIRENLSFTKMRSEIRGMKLLLRLRPLIRLFGVRLDKDLRRRAEDLEQEFERLASMPDRFNDLFADRGWIAYEQLNQELMEQAVELGEAGDIEAAEEALVEHFNEDRIVWGIKFLWASPDFRPRERLARLALEDYLAERYHACIPVLLLIIDGFVNDVTKSKGFFAEGTEMLAWDSIAAHDRGLMHLARQWNRGRNRTSTEPLTIPYRNGILHGRDLAYDQKIVAAKL